MAAEGGSGWKTGKSDWVMPQAAEPQELIDTGAACSSEQESETACLLREESRSAHPARSVAGGFHVPHLKAVFRLFHSFHHSNVSVLHIKVSTFLLLFVPELLFTSSPGSSLLCFEDCSLLESP